MNQKQRAKWEQIRAKGIWRFILFYGVRMSIGLIIALSLFDYFFSPVSRVEDLYFDVPVFFVTGLLTVSVIWFVNEYQYQKRKPER